MKWSGLTGHVRVGLGKWGNDFGIRKGEDEMRAKERVDAVGRQFGVSGPIFRHEHVVAHHLFGQRLASGRHDEGQND